MASHHLIKAEKNSSSTAAKTNLSWHGAFYGGVLNLLHPPTNVFTWTAACCTAWWRVWTLYSVAHT